MIDTRVRLLAIGGALVLLLLIVDLVRRRRLKEEYSVLWVVSALVLLLLASWLELLEWLTTAIGGVTLSSTLFFFALLFVFFMLLHFSLRVSTLERRLTTLVQEVGLQGVTPAGERSPAPAPAAEPPSGEPRVAVVIPCFDDGPLVGEAVDSVQEDEPVEIVVVDDGSSDPDTVQRLLALERRGVRVLRQSNGGPGVARTAGLHATAAPYVYPLDADDCLEPGALAALADELERRPDAGFVWGDYVLFGEYDGRYRSPDGWLPWTLTYVNPYPVSSLFRRDVLERAEGWQGNGYEDWDLWLRLAGQGVGGARVDRVVYRRRLHGDGRVQVLARSRHRELYATLRRRNADVFEARARLRASERPAAWKVALYPLLFGWRRVVPARVEAALQRWMMRRGSGLPGSAEAARRPDSAPAVQAPRS